MYFCCGYYFYEFLLDLKYIQYEYFKISGLVGFKRGKISL
ncbi:Uncharacterised protein [Serratia liquefaciens]|nr:Uncharacterised protein [Serratia liquefaciens]